MRCPRAWLAVVWFFEHGVAINGWKLHELSGVAQSSAFNLLKKFTTIIRELMPEDGPTVSSDAFRAIYSKRSRETPAGKHPCAEEDEMHVSRSSQPSTDCIKDKAGNLAEQETDEPMIEDEAQRNVYSLLSTEPMHFDLLCAKSELPAGRLCALLTMLELNDLIERKVGEYYVRQHKKGSSAEISLCEKSTDEAHAKANEIIGFIRVVWRGISRKYVQNYVSIFWFLQNATVNPMLSLFDACMRSAPLGYERTIGYISPPLIKVGELR
jgi:hypothetical protein